MSEKKWEKKKVKENKKYRCFLLIGLAPHEEDQTQVLPTHVTNAGMLITRIKQQTKQCRIKEEDGGSVRRPLEALMR